MIEGGNDGRGNGSPFRIANQEASRKCAVELCDCKLSQVSNIALGVIVLPACGWCSTDWLFVWRFSFPESAAQGFDDKKVLPVTLDEEVEEAPAFVWDGEKASSKPECTAAVCGVIDILQDMYGKTMHRLLHIGPGTCGIVSKLLKESNSEVWGIQPSRLKKPVHKICRDFVRKGLVRVAEVHQPLPYRSRSFSFVLVSDTLDVMKKRDLNVTLPELSRLSAHNLIVVVGKSRSPVPESKAIPGLSVKLIKPRTRDWWMQLFHDAGLKEDEEKRTHFEAAVTESGMKSSFHIFHLIVPSFSSTIARKR